MRPPRPRLWGGIPLALLLLTGCGDDRPYTPPPPRPPRQAQAAPADRPSAAAPAYSTPAGPPDPLVGDAGQAPPEPLAGHDPLTSSDPLQGRAMPTKHSHWLNAEMWQARVTVLLNGARLGGAIAPGTQDVTMRMRPGVNTLTVIYEPRDESSWGSVTLSEGEHEARAVVLAAFRRAPLARSSATDTERARMLKPVTETLTFSAQ